MFCEVNIFSRETFFLVNKIIHKDKYTNSLVRIYKENKNFEGNDNGFTFSVLQGKNS